MFDQLLCSACISAGLISLAPDTEGDKFTVSSSFFRARRIAVYSTHQIKALIENNYRYLIIESTGLIEVKTRQTQTPPNGGRKRIL